MSGNVNKARVRGVQLDGELAPLPWLQIGGAFTYTDAVYTDPRATVGAVSLSFGPYADTPKYSGSAFVRASTKLANGAGELVARGDIYAQSKSYYTNLGDTLTPGTNLIGYHIVNGRLEWNNIAGTKVSAAAFVRNITNEKYYAGGLGIGAVIGVNGRLLGEPRLFGGELSVKF